MSGYPIGMIPNTIATLQLLILKGQTVGQDGPSEGVLAQLQRMA